MKKIKWVLIEWVLVVVVLVLVCSLVIMGHYGYLPPDPNFQDELPVPELR